MAISFVILSIYFFNNRTRLNKILEIPGNETLEIFLFHQFVVDIMYFKVIWAFFLQNRIDLYLIFIPLIIIISIGLALPFYLLGRYIKTERRIRKTIIIISSSLIIYTLTIYTFNLFSIISNLYSFVLFGLLIITVGMINFLIYIIWKKSVRNKL